MTETNVKQAISIPWAGPHFWGNEQDYVIDALRSSWISGGQYVERFESEFSRFCNTRYAITASNGTTALHMAYLALGIRQGDEVIVPGFGFMAAANVAIHMGAKPVFTEVDGDTWCMTSKNIESRLTPKTKAIIPIHTYGNVCDMDPILELAGHHGIAIIEDAAEAIGSRYRGRMAGTLAKIGVYSFHATKTITTGEGGAAITDDSELYDRMKLYRNHGMSSLRYWHDVAGHNFRLTNMQAALGCAQLEHIDLICIERNRVYSNYLSHLDGIEGIHFQYYPSYVEPLVWAVAVKLDLSVFPQGRDMVIRQLSDMQIETRPGFFSASMMKHLYEAKDLPICEDLSRTVISLPSSPVLTNAEIDYVCSSLKSIRR
jgi:perosamine synthetase